MFSLFHDDTEPKQEFEIELHLEDEIIINEQPIEVDVRVEEEEQKKTEPKKRRKFSTERENASTTTTCRVAHCVVS